MNTPSYFYPRVSAERVHTPTAILLETGLLLIWFALMSLLGVLLSICVGTRKLQQIRRSMPNWAQSCPRWPWRTTSWQQISSCIDFYFRGWVIWVAALQPQLGWPPRSPGSILESLIVFLTTVFLFLLLLFYNLMAMDASSGHLLLPSLSNWFNRENLILHYHTTFPTPESRMQLTLSATL